MAAQRSLSIISQYPLSATVYGGESPEKFTVTRIFGLPHGERSDRSKSG